MQVFGTYRSPPNLFPRKLSTGDVGDNDFAPAVEAHDFHADGASSPAFNFVLVAEKIHARFSTAVIEPALDQDTQHGTFASVDCLQSASHVHGLSCIRKNTPFPTTAILVSITSSTFSGRCRNIIFPLKPVSFASRGPTSTSPPTLRVISIL